MPTPIRQRPKRHVTKPVSTPSRDASAPPAAAPGKKKPVWGTAPGAKPRDGFNVGAAVADALRPSGPSPFELVPGRVPNAVGLPQVLGQLGATPEGRAAAGNVLELLKAKTGLALPAEVQAAVLSNPAAATSALVVTPAQLSEGMLALNASARAGTLKPVEPPKRLLPQHVDLAALDGLAVPRPQPQLKELAPGLYTGDLPGALPDADLKRNQVMAEVFDRLAANASAPAGERFDVRYGGKTYARLDDFLGALQADGYQVTVSFNQRAANFADLKALVPNSNPPAYVDVPAPLMLRTGLKDAAGHEAVVPAAHSEMLVSLRAGPVTRGPRLDSDTRFFQGVSGTGFFPAGATAEPAWLGKVTHATLRGDDATRAVGLAGAFTDLVNTTAREQRLYAGGYGLTGVCNDSVAVVQQAMTGRADQYPLLMRDSVLAGELSKRLVAGGRDNPAYAAIKQAIDTLPSDAAPNDSQRARALASLSWQPGHEPFASTVEARRILGR